MALRFLSFPSTFSTQQKLQTLTPQKHSSLSLLSNPSRSHLSITSITQTKPNPFILQASSTTQQQSPPSVTPESPPEPKTRLIAQNIPWSSTSDDIRTLFQSHGTVENVELSMYNKTRNRGLAFVTMGSEEEATEAIAKLDSYQIEDRTISVAHAKPRKKKIQVVPVSSTPKYDVFIANLSWKVKSKDLIEFFSSMKDDVISADITYQLNPTRKPTGYGFVAFRSKEKAEEAITSFQGKVAFESRVLVVDLRETSFMMDKLGNLLQELMGKPVRLAHSNRTLKAEANDGTSAELTTTEIISDKGESDSVDQSST